MNYDLFDTITNPDTNHVELGQGTKLLNKFAHHMSVELLQQLNKLIQISPFRNMIAPNGHAMSVAMTNCGIVGWVSDHKGYCYSTIDPLTGKNWPDMPTAFEKLAVSAAESAGYTDFSPSCCLINKYQPGTKLSLHQDKNENNLSAPIVSVSLGVMATFVLGGLSRDDRVTKIALTHGDVIVWGGTGRLRYHGVLPIKNGYHPETGSYRINLTFRQVGGLRDSVANSDCGF